MEVIYSSIDFKGSTLETAKIYGGAPVATQFDREEAGLVVDVPGTRVEYFAASKIVPRVGVTFYPSWSEVWVKCRGYEYEETPCAQGFCVEVVRLPGLRTGGKFVIETTPRYDEVWTEAEMLQLMVRHWVTPTLSKLDKYDADIVSEKISAFLKIWDGKEPLPEIEKMA